MVFVVGMDHPVFSCDNVLESGQEIDKCGVCGGDGSSRLLIQSRFVDTNVKVGSE